MLITVVLLRGIPVRAFSNGVLLAQYLQQMVGGGQNLSEYTFDTIQLDGE